MLQTTGATTPLAAAATRGTKPPPADSPHMHSLIVAFERQEGMDADELREYYHEEHAPIVEDLPNLAGYRVTFAGDPEQSPFDAVAVLDFESGAAMAEALDSEAAAEMQADGANFLDPDSMTQVLGETEVLVE